MISISLILNKNNIKITLSCLTVASPTVKSRVLPENMAELSVSLGIP